jgi:ribosomal protein L35
MQSMSARRCGIVAAPQVLIATPAPRATVICTAIEAKYKLKTRKAAAKRYKITGSGKVLRRHAGKQHLNEKMRPKQMKRLSKEESVFAGDVRFPVLFFPYIRLSQKQGTVEIFYRQQFIIPVACCILVVLSGQCYT